MAPATTAESAKVTETYAPPYEDILVKFFQAGGHTDGGSCCCILVLLSDVAIQLIFTPATATTQASSVETV
jgi:hypothetical protein